MTIDLRLGDCFELMREIPDKSVDAVITDPPYNVGLDYCEGDRRLDYKEWCNQWRNEARRISDLTVFSPGIVNLWIHPPPEWVLCWNKKFSGTRGGKVAVVNRWEPLLLYGNVKKKLGGDVFDVMSDCYLNNHKGAIYDTGNHPCPKPLDLMIALVNGLTSEGDTIIDPFMGSGTTGVACVKLNRNFIGMEISPEYFKIAQRRIAEAQAQIPMVLA